MGNVYFISGTDTGTGKTIATGMMARFLLGRGVKTATVKLVQTGCHNFSEDLDMHRKLMGIGRIPEDDAGWTAPQIFDFPASPHLAAALEHRTVDTEKIAESVRKTAENYDITLAEGAGGLAVPLTEDLLTVDFAARQKWNVILVTSGKLGAINHFLLSLEALIRRGMKLTGVVWNYSPEADPVIDGDSPELIGKYLRKTGRNIPLIRLGKTDPEQPEQADLPDFSPFFRELDS